MSLRIISGERRGAKLQTPEGTETRPLRDRLREALFSMLRSELRDAVVCDVFAGSGAVGLEALSNGVQHATFCEMSTAACKAIRQNVTKLRYEDRSKLLQGEAPQIIASYKPPAPYSILFLMPPYHSRLCEKTLRDKQVKNLCTADALAVCEIHRDETIPELEGWTKTRERLYGVTRLVFYVAETGEPGT